MAFVGIFAFACEFNDMLTKPFNPLSPFVGDINDVQAKTLEAKPGAVHPELVDIC